MNRKVSVGYDENKIEYSPTLGYNLHATDGKLNPKEIQYVDILDNIHRSLQQRQDQNSVQ